MAESQALHLEQPHLQFVETMAQALDARDPYTAGHSLRVADYSYSIAVGMGLSEAEARTIYIAAQLHDIGKIGIPDAVLQKRSRLTAEEFALIKLHPQIGRRILERVSSFDRYLNVVELHHENTDGTGYPYGLRGLQIPLDARIVRVADAFDAMTSNRSYRSRWTAELAQKEIFAFSGKHFDREVATVFLNLAAEGRIEVVPEYMPTNAEAEAEFHNLLALSDALSVPQLAAGAVKNN
jgi:putative two-component system response regulator